MRRALLLLLAGFALAALLGTSAGAEIVTVGTTPLTSESPTYTDSKGLEPLPSGARAQPDSRLPHSDTAGFILLAFVALVLIAALVLFAVGRVFAVEPHWVTDGRHSLAEAGWHVSNTWAEFKDWARLGR